MAVEETKSHFDKLNDALDSGEFRQIRFTLNSTLRPTEVARLIENRHQKSAKSCGI